MGTKSINKLLVIAGSAKCGTTSIAHWLNQSPAFLRGIRKEPCYFTNFHNLEWRGPGSENFATQLLSTPERYIDNFPNIEPDQWAIDASTDYIWSDGALERIKSYSSTRDVKVICVVRDPLSRAISEYNHTLRHNWEKERFGQSIIKEKERIEQRYIPLFYHVRRSKVFEDLQRAKTLFGANLLIIDYGKLTDPQMVMRMICNWIGVDCISPDNTDRRNQTFLPRNRLSKALLENRAIRRIGKFFPPGVRTTARNLLKTNSREIETVSQEEKEKFLAILHHDISACRKSELVPTDSWAEH